jgi:hypothetical protein
MIPVVRSMVIETAAREALDRLFKEVPFLGLPVIRQLVVTLVFRIVGYMDEGFKKIDLHFDFKKIEKDVNQQLLKVEVAQHHFEESLDDPEKNLAAREELRRALSDLIRLRQG